MSYSRDEVERAFQRYWKIGAVEEQWDRWALDVFTEDVRYVEHIYGIMEGRDAVHRWITKLMATNHHVHAVLNWYMIEDARVVLHMDNRYYDPAGGEPLDFAGVTILEYGGRGRFRYEEDFWDLSDAKSCHERFQAALAEHGDAGIAETPERMRARDPWPDVATPRFDGT